MLGLRSAGINESSMLQREGFSGTSGVSEIVNAPSST